MMAEEIGDEEKVSIAVRFVLGLGMRIWLRRFRRTATCDDGRI